MRDVIVVVAIPSWCWDGRNITVTWTAVIAAAITAAAVRILVLVHTLNLGGMLLGHIHHLLGVGR